MADDIYTGPGWYRIFSEDDEDNTAWVEHKSADTYTAICPGCEFIINGASILARIKEKHHA